MNVTTMRTIDVFNGDADGLCALHQLRLAEPADSELVTGLKREIDLLARVTAGADARVTVLDLSLDRNRSALERLLAAGAQVRYIDHHHAGALPTHLRLELHIEYAPTTCTSLLVDRLLGGRFAAWAVVGAYGDNLRSVADDKAHSLGLDPSRAALLRVLGEALNYNAYGETDADVAIHPRELYRRLHRFADPFEFHAREPIVETLVARRGEDLAQALQVAPTLADPQFAVFDLPDAGWTRRVLGTFAHHLATAHPQRAHAVFRVRADGRFTVSLRAPQVLPFGADRLCRQFGGGGRAAAAGIDALHVDRRAEFIAALRAADWRCSDGQPA
jgi:hypothetical protein